MHENRLAYLTKMHGGLTAIIQNWKKYLREDTSSGLVILESINFVRLESSLSALRSFNGLPYV